MNLTIRRARESDRKAFDWTTYRIDLKSYKPYVVTVDGEPFVAFGPNREIVWQNGGDSVADLVRIAVRFFNAMQTIHYDKDELKHERTVADLRKVRER